jgi:hypothetical protein
MEKHKILARIYWSTSILVMMLVMISCLVFNWKSSMMLSALTACLVISAPAVIMVNAIHWILQRVVVETAFAWIILLSSIPLLVIVPAILFADELPGDVFFLVVLGLISSYAGLFGHGLSITKLFKPENNE